MRVGYASSGSFIMDIILGLQNRHRIGYGG